MSKRDTTRRSVRCLFLIRRYIIFFLLMAFVITCCMILFLNMMTRTTGLELTQEHIEQAAKVTFLNVLLFLYGIHRNIIRRKAVKKGLRWSDKAETAVLVLVIAVILTVYVIRLIRQDSPVMELSPEKGLVFRVAELIREMLST